MLVRKLDPVVRMIRSHRSVSYYDQRVYYIVEKFRGCAYLHERVNVNSSNIETQENFLDDGSDASPPIFCYQCNSGVDLDCTNLQANSTNSVHYKPCSDLGEYKGAKPFCRKIVQTIFERNNMVRVIRKCGWEKHPRLDCYNMANDDHTETVCQCFQDGCNSAYRFSAAGAVLAMLLALCHILVS
ncbi:hypothetical protein J6590_021705 [Homalodisca vitripennis]|nr:hypothetical protein J6590_021705 [Homalodisca vitripennis]